MVYGRRAADGGQGASAAGGWLGLIALGLTGVALALLGSSKAYGALFVLSLPCAALAAWPFIDRHRLRLDGPQLMFVGSAIGLCLLVLTQIAVGAADTGDLEGYGRFLAGFVAAGLLFVVLRFDGERLFRFLVFAAAAQLLASTVVALWQTVDFGQGVEAGMRAHGATNAIPFSEMVAISGGLVAIDLAGRYGRDRRVADVAGLCLAMAMTVLAVSLSGTRGTMLALVPLLFFVSLSTGRGASIRVGAVAAGAAVCLVAAYATVDARVGEAITDVGRIMTGGPGTVSLSVQDRLSLWSAAIDLIRERPIFGYGFGALGPGSAIWPPPGQSGPELASYNHVHNLYLDTMLKAGVVGLLLLGAVLAAPLWTGFRSLGDPARRTRALAALWVGSGYAVFGLTQAVTSHANTALQLGIYVAIMLRSLGSVGEVQETLAVNPADRAD